MPGQIDELISKIKTVIPEDAAFEEKGGKEDNHQCRHRQGHDEERSEERHLQGEGQSHGDRGCQL